MIPNQEGSICHQLDIRTSAAVSTDLKQMEELTGRNPVTAVSGCIGQERGQRVGTDRAAV